MQSILAYSPSYFTIASLYQTHIIIATIRCNVTEILFLLLLCTQLNKIQSMVALLLDFLDWIILCHNSWTINFCNENCSKFHYNIDTNYIKILHCLYLGIHIFCQSLHRNIYKQYFQKYYWILELCAMAMNIKSFD